MVVDDMEAREKKKEWGEERRDTFSGEKNGK